MLVLYVVQPSNRGLFIIGLSKSVNVCCCCWDGPVPWRFAVGDEQLLCDKWGEIWPGERWPWWMTWPCCDGGRSVWWPDGVLDSRGGDIGSLLMFIVCLLWFIVFTSSGDTLWLAPVFVTWLPFLKREVNTLY